MNQFDAKAIKSRLHDAVEAFNRALISIEQDCAEFTGHFPQASWSTERRAYVHDLFGGFSDLIDETDDALREAEAIARNEAHDPARTGSWAA